MTDQQIEREAEAVAFLDATAATAAHIHEIEARVKAAGHRAEYFGRVNAAFTFQQCADELDAALPPLVASSRETTKDTDARQSSPFPVRTTGSPREPMKGSER